MTTAATTREQWLAERAKGIGSSDSPVILGLRAYASPWDVWARKVGLLPADDPEVSNDPRVRAGALLEEPVAQWYAQESGRALTDPGRHAIQKSAEHPWLLATLDRIIPAAEGKPGPGVLEIKTTGAERREDWDGEAPLPVQVQVQHQLAVTGMQWASIVVLIGGQHLRWIDVERNDRFIAAMVPRLAAFWRLVEEKTPPPADGHPLTAEVLARLYPQSVDLKTVALPADFLDADARREALLAEIKERETALAKIDNEIKAAMGDAEFGALPNGVAFTLRAQTRKSYTVAEATFRVLRRKKARA